MRIIKTEMYFEEISGGEKFRRRTSWRRDWDEEKYNHGIAFAWIKNVDGAPFDIQKTEWFDGEKISTENIPLAIDALLRDEDGHYSRILHRSMELKNQAVIEYVLDQPIILEQSPPSAIPFRQILAKTNIILIGSAIGYANAGDSPLLLFVLVPGGIIVVGSAVGVAEAFAAGLNKKISRMFKKL